MTSFSDFSFQTSVESYESDQPSRPSKTPVHLPRPSLQSESIKVKHNPPVNRKLSWSDAWKICSVEPIMFMHSLVYYMMLPIIQKFIMDKLCAESEKSDSSNKLSCVNMSYDKYEEDLDRSTANYLMYHTLVQITPGAIFCIFLGSWSDNHGRKLPLILSSVGAFLSHFGLLMLVIHDKNPTYMVLVATIPYGLLGGPATFAMAAYSYLSDISTTSARMMRFSILDAMSYAGGPIGVFIGGRLEHYFGYKCVFTTAMCLDLLIVCYVVFVISETIQDLGSYGGHYYWDLINVKSFVKTYKTVFRTRDFELHKSVKLVLVIHCLISVAMRGEEVIGFLYVHAKFQWSLLVYTVFVGYYMMLCLTGLLLATPLFSWKLKVSDAKLGSVGCISRFVASVFIALSTNSLMVFIAATTGMLSNFASVSVRTIMSKLVEQDELGKSFAVMSMLEAIAPIVASILYSQLYSVSLAKFPELVYLLSAALVSIAFFCFGWLRKNLDPEALGDLDLGEKRPLLEELDFQEEPI